MATVTINSAFITLGQLLKEAGVVASGGQVKWFLAEHVVQVNGEADTRRGRKLYPGDTLTLPDGQVFTVAAGE